MPYFKNFPYILYPNFQNKNNDLFLKDITTRVVRRLSPSDDKYIFYKYIIKENKSLEKVSLELYGTEDYYWTIQLANNLFDRFYDFPLEYNQFNLYIENKYGSIESAKTQYKYYVRPNVERYSTDEKEDLDNFQEVPSTLPITLGGSNYDNWTAVPQYVSGIKMKYSKDLYQWESELNEKKREVYVVHKDYILQFVAEFERLVS